MKKSLFRAAALALSMLMLLSVFAGCGKQGSEGPQGPAGADGKSAYDLAVENGYKGTLTEWLIDLVGEVGAPGANGTDGKDGADGKSAYELAVEKGYKGTLDQWLESLIGKAGTNGSDGVNGKSAYELACENGFNGSLSAWLDSLVGKDGVSGVNGKSAYDIAVTNGFHGTITEWLASLVGKNGTDGVNGKSAYELAVENGFTGSLNDWLKTLVGANGGNGKSAYDLAKELGYKGTEAQWIASLSGKSAYDIAVEKGYSGTAEEWLASLVGEAGENGKSAYEVAKDNGYTGSESEWLSSLIGPTGVAGSNGDDGKSAYELAKANGFNGTLSQWLDSLVGATGTKGEQGNKGDKGDAGKSAYDLAVENGFEGTVTEWLASLVGKDGAAANKGDDGKSAYDLAVENGYSGTLQEWLASLVGAKGDKGEQGEQGGVGQTGKSAYELAKENGYKGSEAEWLASLTGLSAYQVAVKNGYAGTETEWLASLVGEAGERGEQGATGKSAYEIAKDNGYTGTEEQWLATLIGPTGAAGAKGADGANGKSAYELAVENGFTGTIAEWLTSLVGVRGEKGDKGDKGETGVSVVGAYIDERTHLILKMSDNTTILKLTNVDFRVAGNTQLPPTLNSPIELRWLNATEDIHGDFVFATLTFEVNESAPIGKETAIRVTYDKDDVYNLAEEDIALIINGGFVTITCIPGDINNDKKTNQKDVSRLLQYLSGWNVSVNAPTLDVNGDNKVNQKDVSRLLQYLAGWNVKIYPQLNNNCEHNFVGHLAKPATCTETGNIAYWQCSECGKCFRDEAGTRRITFDETIIQPTDNHTLEAIPAVAPTCTEAGNIAYWHCTECGKYFSDEVATKEISLENTILPAKGHTYSEAWSYDETYHWHEATCQCDTAGIADKADHTIGENGKCMCGYSAENNYVVQYYLENIEDGYTLTDTVSGYAVAGTLIEADIKEYAHFTAKDKSVNGTVSGDGITVLKVYYDRERYTITFDANGGKLFGSAIQKVKYGGNAVLPEFERDHDENYYYVIDHYSGSYENVQSDATVKVIWKQLKKDELASPSNINLGLSENDKDQVTWTAVPNATHYIVHVGDYEFKTRDTKCNLEELKFNGNPISNYGNVSVTVTAIDENGRYKNATSTAVEYYYVPETTNSETVTQLETWPLGMGYNLLEDPYLKMMKHPKAYVFNQKKLATIGESSFGKPNHEGHFDAYNFSSVEEYMSQFDIDFSTSSSVSANASFMKFKAAANLKTALSLSMATTLQNYNSSRIVFHNFYITEGIKEIKLDNLTSEDPLKYSLAKSFVEDITTAGANYAERAKLIYEKYGTHAILGVETGAILSSSYVAATNKTDFAIKLHEHSSVETSGEAGASYGKATAGVSSAFNLEQSVSTGGEIKTDDSYVASRIDTYGGTPTVTLSSDPSKAISVDSWKLNDGTGMPISVYGNGAYAISYLIGLYDADFARYYAEYVDNLADEEFKALTKQFERKNSVPMNVTTEDGKNVLTIDVSAYQNSGLSVENVYCPNLAGDVLTVYPTSYGKYIDKIVVKGSFNEADRHNLIPLTLKLSSSWNRNVEICFENCGFEYKNSNNIVDDSDVKLAVNVNVTYNGYNVMHEASSNVYYVHVADNGKTYDLALSIGEDETIDYSSCGITNDGIMLPIASRNGYIFAGWEDAAHVAATDNLGLIIDSNEFNQSLSAVWNKAIFEVTLHNDKTNISNGKYYDRKSENEQDGRFFSDSGCQNSITLIELPTKTGYAFDGYYYTNESISVKMIDSDGTVIRSLHELPENYFAVDEKRVDLYAQWKPNTYTVHYDANGGEGTIADSTFAYDTEGKLTDAKFTNSGYLFAGWKKDPNGLTADYQPGAAVKNWSEKNGDTITLYAHWQYNCYDVVYAANGGVGRTDKSIYCVGESKSLNTNGFSRSGYVFKGWNTEADGTGISYSDKQVVRDLGTVGKAVTLYAMWEVDPYTIGQYVANGTTVSNSAGTKSYKVFTTEIPRYCGESTIIDLSRVTDEISIITDLGEEVYIIGDPNKTYTDGYLCFVNLDENKTCTLHLKDFNLTSTAYSGTINNYSHDAGFAGCTGGNVIIDVTGECSISSTANNGVATINLPKQNVTITGSGTLNVYGANGADGQAYGENGQDGGVGIQANDVVIDMTGTLNVYGGNGGNGMNGADGRNGYNGGDSVWWSSHDGEHGVDGEKGGNGGAGNLAIHSMSPIEIINGTISLYGGKSGSSGSGGKGGNGGNGSDADAIGATGGTGGNAGKGGDSGDVTVGSPATNCGYFVTESSLTIVTSVNGATGSIGTPGIAGSVGAGGNNWWWGSTHGSAGSSASDGSRGRVIYGLSTAGVYNNLDNGTVMHSLENGILKITTNGEASPSLGGFVQWTQSAANMVSYHVIVAKVPVGYTLNPASNAIGDGAYTEWLTSNEGTGEWATYVYRTVCGSSGEFRDFGYIYLAPNADTTVTYPVEWYVSYACMVE